MATSPTPQPVDGVRERGKGVETEEGLGAAATAAGASVRARTLRPASSTAAGFSVAWTEDSSLPSPICCCKAVSSFEVCAALKPLGVGAGACGVAGATADEGTSSSSESSKAPGRGLRYKLGESGKSLITVIKMHRRSCIYCAAAGDANCVAAFQLHRPPPQRPRHLALAARVSSPRTSQVQKNQLVQRPHCTQ